MTLEFNVDGPCRFSVNDIFFSRTDERGIICAGNVVFHDVSAFDWGELIGAPHKLVRHPDMPKAVFHLLWERLQAGKNVGAYVCNRAKDGTPYWVYAMAIPVAGGYLSVRIKPTSEMLKTIVPIYNKLRAAERDDGVSAQDSEVALHAAIADLGFEDYPAFMAHALDLEMNARCDALRVTDCERIAALRQMHDAVQQIDDLAVQVMQIFHSTDQIPYNMRLQAGRLEASGGPISVISNNHRQMTQELKTSLDDFCDSAKVGHRALLAAGFQNRTAHLLEEVHDSFMREDFDHKFDTAAETQRLEALSADLKAKADAAIAEVSGQVRKFGLKCSAMRRMMSGLELTRMMCKIERSKFDGEHDGLDEVVNRLSIAQSDLNATFDEINNRVSDILSLSSALHTPGQRVA